MSRPRFKPPFIRILSLSKVCLGLLAIAWTAAAWALPPVPRQAPVRGQSGYLPASEGLKSRAENMPEVVRKAFDSVFFLWSQGRTYGTAYLIGAHERGDKLALTFVTNHHVVAGACSQVGMCGSLTLAQEALVEKEKIDDGTGKMIDGPSLAVNYLGGLRFDFAEIVAISSNPDIAVLRVYVPRGTRVPKPLPLAASIETPKRGTDVYAIGFPNTTLRTLGAPIEDGGGIYKRWSKGKTISLAWSDDEMNEKTEKLLVTTLDALRGMSGGPVLNENGEVVATVVAIFSGPEYNYAYIGKEEEANLQPHAATVPLFLMVPLLMDALSGF